MLAEICSIVFLRLCKNNSRKCQKIAFSSLTLYSRSVILSMLPAGKGYTFPLCSILPAGKQYSLDFTISQFHIFVNKHILHPFLAFFFTGKPLHSDFTQGHFAPVFVAVQRLFLLCPTLGRSKMKLFLSVVRFLYIVPTRRQVAPVIQRKGDF